jgi:ribosomal protein S18 acetylase RimI-like enzyme
VLVAERAGQLLGYVCYGPTPMTQGTYDLYWIASDPAARGQRVGATLVEAMEADLRKQGGRLVRVETASQESYSGTHRFYAAIQYTEEARFCDFYSPGDDLIILKKKL